MRRSAVPTAMESHAVIELAGCRAVAKKELTDLEDALN